MLSPAPSCQVTCRPKNTLNDFVPSEILIVVVFLMFDTKQEITSAKWRRVQWHSSLCASAWHLKWPELCVDCWWSKNIHSLVIMCCCFYMIVLLPNWITHDEMIEVLHSRLHPLVGTLSFRHRELLKTVSSCLLFLQTATFLLLLSAWQLPTLFPLFPTSCSGAAASGCG